MWQDEWRQWFVDGAALDAADQPRWRRWAEARGVALLAPWLGVARGHSAEVEAALLWPTRRRAALAAPDAPPMLDVVGWLLTPQWWVAFSAVLGEADVVFATDAVRRRSVRSVGLGDRATLAGEPAGADCVQVEFELDGPGFAGLAGRRWGRPEGTLAVTAEGVPLISAPALPADVAAFIQALMS